MEIVRCNKGHFYDAELNSTCPQCLAEEQQSFGAPLGVTEPVVGAPPDWCVAKPPDCIPSAIGPTEPIPIGAAEPAPGYLGGLPPTEPVTQPGFTHTDFASNGVTGYRVQSYDPTRPVSPNDGPFGFNPVVGWLVCVDGPDKGTDYRIHNGYNYIGRAQSMNICIMGDDHISNLNAAVIGYDDVERLFSFGPSGGHNTVRVNGKMVINAVELKPYDVLTIGTTRLMFVPLCGENFDWNAK